MNKKKTNRLAFAAGILIGVAAFFAACALMDEGTKAEKDRNEEINTHVLAAWENGDPGEHECPCPEFCTKHYYEWLKMKARAK